jgi:tetratricopeptide (TPR) repeat protein
MLPLKTNNYKHMKYHLVALIMFCFLFVGELQAQKMAARTDSLLNILQKQSGDKKLQTLDKLFDYYHLVDVDSAGYFAELLFKESEAQSNKIYIIKSNKNLGILYTSKGEFYKAEEYLVKAIELAKANNSPTELASSYRIIAGVYFERGDFNIAINYVYKALDLYEEINDFEGIVSCYNNIGLLYKRDSDYKKAISSYYKGLKLIDKHNLKNNKISFYTNLGISYRYLNNPDSSYFFQKKAIAESIRVNAKSDLASNYLNMAKLFASGFHQKDSAEYYFEKALSLAKVSHPSLIPTILSSKGKMYYLAGDYDNAVEVLNTALLNGIRNRNLFDKEFALYYLYKSFQKKKQFPDALKYLEDFIDVQDSINYNEAQIKINRLQEKYENEKKQIKIEQLEYEQKLNKRTNLLLVLSIILITIIFGLLIRDLLKQRKRSRLETERIENDLQMKNKQLTSQALMMMQKNKLLNDILNSLAEIKSIGLDTNANIRDLKRKLKRGLNSERDWELFRHYFESVNKDFFEKLKKINSTLTPAELKLSALTKLRFNIKETAALLNISEGSIKSSRYILRKKLGLNREDNIYNFLNKL